MKYVIGVDPGNTRAGIALFSHEGLVSSWTIRPWVDVPFDPGVGKEKVKVYVEVPQSGTHTSRGGVHWSAGMIVAGLVATVPMVSRKSIVKIPVGRWRKAIFPMRRLDREGWKHIAMERYPMCQTDDEAEACCIAEYGCRVEKVC